MTYHQFWHPLTAVCDEREARAVASWLLDVAFGLSLTDVAAGAVEGLQGEQLQQLTDMQQRLLQGEPVQYVAGVADFGPRQFMVSPAVLIPRPETYELCQWVAASGGQRVLDIGTGSGCIACTLALDMPGATLSAWDISAEALHVARANAQRLGVHVAFELCDALHATPPEASLWHVIVSNPPYICRSERHHMQQQVTDHEPSLALFVPDDDPLLFYRAIARYALRALLPGGMLFFELDAAHATTTEQLLRDMGFSTVELRNDQFGRPRFLKAIRP